MLKFQAEILLFQPSTLVQRSLVARLLTLQGSGLQYLARQNLPRTQASGPFVRPSDPFFALYIYS